MRRSHPFLPMRLALSVGAACVAVLVVLAVAFLPHIDITKPPPGRVRHPKIADTPSPTPTPRTSPRQRGHRVPQSGSHTTHASATPQDDVSGTGGQGGSGGGGNGGQGPQGPHGPAGKPGPAGPPGPSPTPRPTPTPTPGSLGGAVEDVTNQAGNALPEPAATAVKQAGKAVGDALDGILPPGQ